jgi:hypothetical protein
MVFDSKRDSQPKDRSTRNGMGLSGEKFHWQMDKIREAAKRVYEIEEREREEEMRQQVGLCG